MPFERAVQLRERGLNLVGCRVVGYPVSLTSLGIREGAVVGPRVQSSFCHFPPWVWEVARNANLSLRPLTRWVTAAATLRAPPRRSRAGLRPGSRERLSDCQTTTRTRRGYAPGAVVDNGNRRPAGDGVEVAGDEGPAMLEQEARS